MKIIVSLKDESPVSGTSIKEEGQISEPYSKEDSPEHGPDKMGTFAIEECVLNEGIIKKFFGVYNKSKDESDSPNTKTEIKETKLMKPVFLLDVDREMRDLKEELQINDDPNIHIINGNFALYYQLGVILGEGTTGTVKKCIKNDTGASFAVKMVNYKNDVEMLVLV